jgi:hypothetical protein
MKRQILIACAALALAACGQAEKAEPEAPAAAQSAYDQILSQSGEMQLVAAYQALAAYQAAHPEVQPTCRAVRATESRGIIPAEAAPDSIYAAHVGSVVYSVQCGELISRQRMDPREHWLVIYAPGAAEPAIVNCANGTEDACPRQVVPAPATP